MSTMNPDLTQRIRDHFHTPYPSPGSRPRRASYSRTPSPPPAPRSILKRSSTVAEGSRLMDRQEHRVRFKKEAEVINDVPTMRKRDVLKALGKSLVRTLSVRKRKEDGDVDEMAGPLVPRGNEGGLHRSQEVHGRR